MRNYFYYTICYTWCYKLDRIRCSFSIVIVLLLLHPPSSYSIKCHPNQYLIILIYIIMYYIQDYSTRGEILIVCIVISGKTNIDYKKVLQYQYHVGEKFIHFDVVYKKTSVKTNNKLSNNCLNILCRKSWMSEPELWRSFGHHLF